MQAFGDVWLARYPRPQYIGFDNGNEYKKVFRTMCNNYGIKPKTSTTYNTQSNGIIEHIHQVLDNALRVFELDGREVDTKDPFAAFYQQRRMQSEVRTTLHYKQHQLN